jgi:hypothetical protein
MTSAPGGPDATPEAAPDADEQRGLDLMNAAAARIVSAVDELGARWVERTVMAIVDAWDGLDPARYDDIRAAAGRAGDTATARVATDLRALFALDPAEQRTTPLELVRTLRFEVTEVLRAADVPEVERDEFEVRSFPDDLYGIVPRSLGDLDPADEELGPTLLAWGMGKSTVLRARALRDDMGKG